VNELDEAIDQALGLQGADLLDAVGGAIRRYVVVTDAQRDGLALWCAPCHAFDAADATGYPHITSVERESGDWYGKPLTTRELAKMLKPFGIKPKVIRIGDATPRGFERAAFEDAWTRYLPDTAPRSATSATSAPLSQERVSGESDLDRRVVTAAA